MVEEPIQEKNSTSTEFWKELLKLVVISLLIVIPFRIFIAQPFIVEGASMIPTFKSGEYLIVDEISYRFIEPKRGDVLVFKYPVNPKKSFIKRIIGLPGETVSIDEGLITITSSEYPGGLILKEPYVKFNKIENLDYTLNPEEYFVMGDNRLSSADSRIWGPVPKKNIIGRPLLRFLPPNIFPGINSFTIKNTTRVTP